MKQKFIGFIENNDHEGENFGYYFPVTLESLDLLEQFESILEANNVLGECGGEYEIEEGSYTEKELSMMEKGARNIYMKRVNYPSNPLEKLSALVQIKSVGDLPYKGKFEVDGVRYDLTS